MRQFEPQRAGAALHGDRKPGFVRDKDRLGGAPQVDLMARAALLGDEVASISQGDARMTAATAIRGSD